MLSQLSYILRQNLYVYVLKYVTFLPHCMYDHMSLCWWDVSQTTQYAIDNVAQMRPDMGQGIDDGLSYRKPSYTARAAHHIATMIPKTPSYISLIKNHPWYTDPEGIAITLGNSSIWRQWILSPVSPSMLFHLISIRLNCHRSTMKFDGNIW